MNFREYFREKIPGLWFVPGSWMEKLKEVLLMPMDISMQVLDYIPRLRDLKHKNTPEDGLIAEAIMRGFVKYYQEPAFRERILDSWNVWAEAGSRYGLHRLITMVGYTLDTTVHEYGIEEHLEHVKYAYWGDVDDPTQNRGVVFGQYYWGGYIISKFAYAIHVSDPDELIMNSGDVINQTKINELVHMCSKYAPAHCILSRIFFTDGAGFVINSKVLVGNVWAEA